MSWLTHQSVLLRWVVLLLVVVVVLLLFGVRMKRVHPVHFSHGSKILQARPQKKSQPVNQRERNNPTLATPTLLSPQSGAISSPTGVPSLYHRHDCHGQPLCMQGNASGNYSHPEIVHFTFFSGSPLKFTFRYYLSVLSVHKFFKPKRIILHANFAPYGTYWDLAVNTTIIEYNHVKKVTHIGGKAPGYSQHIADFTKLSLLLQYGGVALDFDTISLNGTRLREEQRRGECVLNCEMNCSTLNIGVFSCIKGARFLHDWKQLYLKDYRPREWIYNSGYSPTAMLKKGNYKVVVDNDISQYPQCPTARRDWRGTGQRVEWRGKTVAHYFCCGVDLPSGKEILDMNNSLGEVFRYVYDYKEDDSQH